jgi:hypothetical protein
LIDNKPFENVAKFMSSCFLSKHLKYGGQKTITLPVVLYKCETWFLILREEHRLMVFENRVLRRIFGHKRKELARGREDCTMKNSIACTLHQTPLG